MPRLRSFLRLLLLAALLFNGALNFAHAQMSGVRVVTACGSTSPWPSLSNSIGAPAWLFVDPNGNLCNGLSTGTQSSPLYTNILSLPSDQYVSGSITAQDNGLTCTTQYSGQPVCSGTPNGTTAIFPLAGVNSMTFDLSGTFGGTVTVYGLANTGWVQLFGQMPINATNTCSSTFTNSISGVQINTTGYTQVAFASRTGFTGPVTVNATESGNVATLSGCTNTVFTDPCASPTNSKTNVTLFQTSSSTFITGVAGKKTYICSFDVMASAAAQVSLVEYSGTCTGGTPYADWGSTTAADGYPLGASGGIAKGSGNGTVISGAGNTNAGYNICLLQNGAANVNASATYVQQ